MAGMPRVSGDSGQYLGHLETFRHGWGWDSFMHPPKQTHQKSTWHVSTSLTWLPSPSGNTQKHQWITKVFTIETESAERFVCGSACVYVLKCAPTCCFVYTQRVCLKENLVDIITTQIGPQLEALNRVRQSLQGSGGQRINRAAANKTRAWRGLKQELVALKTALTQMQWKENIAAWITRSSWKCVCTVGVKLFRIPEWEHFISNNNKTKSLESFGDLWSLYAI